MEQNKKRNSRKYLSEKELESGTSLIEQKLTREINELVECINHINASFIIVTNEVGMGLVPTNRMGRLYRDLLGYTNQRLTETAEEVYIMIAGLPLQIKPSPHFQ